MASENFNRQFILLDFADLDNPDFLAFTRSPEFSTYLVMRRHVWRSREPHYMGLHALYADGALACSLEREQIATLLALSLVSISNDIQALARRAVIESRRTGRQNIFVLGRWVESAGAYYEHFYLDRLYVRAKENLISDLRVTGDKENFISDDNPTRPADLKDPLAINREENTEENREDRSNIRSASPQKKQGGTRGRRRAVAPEVSPKATVPEGAWQQGGARTGEAAELAAARRELAEFVEDLRRELNDQASPGSTLARTVNLYRRSGLGPEEFRDLLYDARRLTQRHTGSIRTQQVGGGQGAIPAKPKMAYFFGVLQNALGLEGPEAPGDADAGRTAPAPGPPPGALPVGDAPAPTAATGHDFVEAVANAAMGRNVNWRLARQLAREDPHLLADWLDHGGAWALARDPGAELAKLVRAGERPPETRISGD
jgi:hypothetical protein